MIRKNPFSFSAYFDHVIIGTKIKTNSIQFDDAVHLLRTKDKILKIDSVNIYDKKPRGRLQSSLSYSFLLNKFFMFFKDYLGIVVLSFSIGLLIKSFHIGKNIQRK